MNDKYAAPSSELMKSERDLNPVPSKKTISVVWVVVASVLLVGVYAGLMVTMLAGVQPTGQTVLGVLVWSGVFGFVVCRYKAKRPIYGIVLGFVISVVLVRLLGYLVIALR